MSKVYFCVLALAFLFSELSNVEAKMTLSQMKSVAKPWSKSCASKVGMDDDLVAAHRRGEFPEDEKLMCYLLCQTKMSKIMDANDKIDLVTVLNQLSTVGEPANVERMMTAFETCLGKMTATEPCRLAYDYSKCYYEVDAEVLLYYN
ncbi:GSCOCT00010668001.3-RA-CDS [Cotesia congregata]|uniref:Odorant binding protein 140.10668 n=1 Tax=Cotesia congregata TaxID=51543 RepID=A0A8J2EF37_COTCN|nr:GSCOCT00010668001.3-RA-CDS [Cotesia congregata]CAG5073268.1 Odorant binding protein 140.10668 [Cotesia congregata]